MADLALALANLERAFSELESYLALPIAHARDKAGLIQGFEFTFELFWKTFQKLAPESGLEASSPREALAAGVNLHFISVDESPHWSQMLRDRNLTSTSCPKFVPGSPRPRCAGEGRVEPGPMGHSAFGTSSTLGDHTYNANVADEIIDRLTSDYVQCFRSALERLRSSSQPP